MKWEVIGISRGSKYSPNMVSSDARILNAVAESLNRMGCEVKIYDEADYVNNRITGKFVFGMARDEATLQYLKSQEQQGTVVVNSAYGIDNCNRANLTKLLMKHQVKHPQSWMVSTSEPAPQVTLPCWVKRGDSCAVVKADVSFATIMDEVNAILSDFNSRGIAQAVINEHLEGDLVKFYGVDGTDFFYWYYPEADSHSKFGLEEINGLAQQFAFDASALQGEANKAAQVLGVPIYGGDAVVAADGSFKIIDFNDWPSFSRCWEEAAPKIAACIYKVFFDLDK